MVQGISSTFLKGYYYQMKYTLFYKNVPFPAQAEYSSLFFCQI